MKIVKLKEFLTYPPDTIFCEYSPCHFGELMLKGDTLDNGAPDFYEAQITCEVESSGSDEMFEILFDAEENGTSFKLDQNCYGRNGTYPEESQLYVVYEWDDLIGMATVLIKGATTVGCFKEILERLNKESKE